MTIFFFLGQCDSLLLACSLDAKFVTSSELQLRAITS